MLLCTDGLTEARTPTNRDDRYDEERLLAFADDLGRASASIAIAAVARLLADLGDGVEDDVAVLALRATPAS
jgi:sigma-B regulation protein RsbU (phosphoserine phosphatase)